MPTEDSLVEKLGEALRTAEWQYDEEYTTARCSGCSAGDYGLSVHQVGCEIADALQAWAEGKVKQ